VKTYPRSRKEESMDMNSERPTTCRDGKGPLPSCGLLAAAYVPVQSAGAAKYRPEDALLKGTLFPGLDLPWMNVSNATPARFTGTPLGELLALSFVVNELGLYLDTHPQDREALQLYTEYVELLKQGQATFTARYGPLEQTQVTLESGYTWLEDPWPWEYAKCPEGMERSGD